MKRLIGVLATLMSMLGLGACDYMAKKELQPGVSTVEDVRALMGVPGTVWQEEDGRRVLEYPRGPAGHETYMVEIAADGRFVAMNNVLTEANFRTVSLGLTRDDVRRKLGKPTDSAYFAALGENVWSWKHQTDEGRSEFFNVHFDRDWILLKTSRSPDPEAINLQ